MKAVQTEILPDYGEAKKAVLTVYRCLYGP